MPTLEPTGRVAGGWFPEVEAFKAAAIVAVVFVHAGRPWWHPGRAHVEQWVELATMAGVPCFLFCSGFLQASDTPVGWAVVRRRLTRLLGPYVVASFLAQLFRRHVLGMSVAAPLRELLLGEAFGAYYYVFVIVTLTLFVPILSRLPRPLLSAVVALFVCAGAVRSLAQWMPEIERALVARGDGAPGGFRTAVRHPLLTWGYFLVGYVMRLRYAQVVGWVHPRRSVLRVTLASMLAGLLAALAFVDIARFQFVSYPLVYLVIAVLTVTWFGRLQRVSEGVAFVARHTYLVYLYHLFLVLGMQRLLPQPPDSFRATYYGLYVVAGLGGPLLLAWLVQRSGLVVLGAWLGAAPAVRAR